MVDNRKTSLEIYCVKDNFLRFFGYSLLSGNPEQALVDAHSIVLTESAARKLFGDEPAEGKMLRFSLLSLLAGMLLAVPLAWFGVRQIDGILPYSPMAMWGVFGVAFLLVALISLGSVCLISWGAVRENPVNHIKTE